MSYEGRPDYVFTYFYLKLLRSGLLGVVGCVGIKDLEGKGWDGECCGACIYIYLLILCLGEGAERRRVGVVSVLLIPV